MKGYTKYYLLVIGIANLILSIVGVIAGLIFTYSPFYAQNHSVIPGGVLILSIGIAIPLFISFFKFKKYSQLKGKELVPYKNSILAWNIVLMILYAPTILVFIFILVSLILIYEYISNIREGIKYNSDGTAKVYFGTRVIETSKDINDGIKEFPNMKSDLEKQTEALTQAQKMKEAGVITEEEYNALRKKILGI